MKSNHGNTSQGSSIWHVLVKWPTHKVRDLGARVLSFILPVLTACGLVRLVGPELTLVRALATLGVTVLVMWATAWYLGTKKNPIHPLSALLGGFFGAMVVFASIGMEQQGWCFVMGFAVGMAQAIIYAKHGRRSTKGA